jgi:DNA-3-methyladenine glycosylase II
LIQALDDPGVMEAAMSHLSRADPVMRKLVEDQGRIDFEPRGMVFRSLVRSILSQQLNGNAASMIISRVNRLFLPGRITPEKLARVRPAGLRRAGVSPQKVTYLKDLASRVVDGRLDLRSLDEKRDEHVIEALDEVRGVGRWTAQMVLIFSLGRPDVLPVDDYGIKIAIKSVYGLGQLPKPRQIEEMAHPWHPYSTVASLYLWRHKDSV